MKPATKIDLYGLAALVFAVLSTVVDGWLSVLCFAPLGWCIGRLQYYAKKGVEKK